MPEPTSSLSQAPDSTPTLVPTIAPTFVPTTASPTVGTGDTADKPTASRDGQGDVNESTYDVNCMERVLGRSVTDAIAYGSRVAIDEELTTIQHCKLGSGYGKSSQDGRGSGDDHGSGDDRCDDQGNCDDDDDGQTPRYDDQGNCVSNCGDDADSYDSSGYTYLCSGNDVDSFGMPTGPQCNLIPPPLRDGVTRGTLLSVSLPEASYQAPIEGCQLLENGKCAELRWERVSDLQA